MPTLPLTLPTLPSILGLQWISYGPMILPRLLSIPSPNLRKKFFSATADTQQYSVSGHVNLHAGNPEPSTDFRIAEPLISSTDYLKYLQITTFQKKKLSHTVHSPKY